VFSRHCSVDVIVFFLLTGRFGRLIKKNINNDNEIKDKLKAITHFFNDIIYFPEIKGNNLLRKIGS
jgi:hypothetical protein